MIGPSNDRIGQRFGPYEITRFLGRGGFADVFLGRNVNLPAQEVAIKVLDKIMIKYDKADQFKKEAAIILTLRHPSIVPFYTYDVFFNPSVTDTAYPYIVMEYAANGSLRSNHPRGTPLSLETIVTYLQQIAGALQYAHSSNVMHLDVKPENILVNKQGKVLLSDFGLATIVTEQRRSTDIQGTLSYMAPEQLEGKPDKASDQYSLAVMVYEWMCGSVPFIGKSIPDHVEKLLHEPPPSLVARVPSLSPVVEAVVMRALAKNPRDRYPTVLQFAEQLEKAIKDPRLVSNAPNSPQLVTPAPPAKPQVMPSAVPVPLPVPVQLPSPPAKASGQNQAAAAIVPASPAPMPQAAPPAPPVASPFPALVVPPAAPATPPPAAAPAVNPPAASPGIPGVGEATEAEPAEAMPAPSANPFFAYSPPRQQEVKEPDPQAPPANMPDPQQAPWAGVPGGMGGQGGMPTAATRSPFFNEAPPKTQAVPGQQAQAHAGAAAPANSTTPFMGYSPSAAQQNYVPGGVHFNPGNQQPDYRQSQTIRVNNFMDDPSPPALPPYLGRTGSGRMLNEPESKSAQEYFSQTMSEIFQPRLGRRKMTASPLFFVFVAASVIGAILFAVWLGHVSQSSGNEVAWMGLILTIIVSLFSFWLFDYSGNPLVKVVAASALGIVWSLFGYAFAADIGAGTNIGILPDPTIMAVLFLFVTLGICLWRVYKRR